MHGMAILLVGCAAIHERSEVSANDAATAMPFENPREDAAIALNAWHCRPHSVSTLPGVEIRFPDPAGCEFTREQARGGAAIVYEVAVAENIGGIGSYALEKHDCMLMPDQLNFYETLGGDWPQDRNSPLDACDTQNALFGFYTLTKGVATRRVAWYGVDWLNTDVAEPIPGDALSAGVYRFSVRAQGVYVDPHTRDAPRSSFEIDSEVDILLTE